MVVGTINYFSKKNLLEKFIVIYIIQFSALEEQLHEYCRLSAPTIMIFIVKLYENTFI